MVLALAMDMHSFTTLYICLIQLALHGFDCGQFFLVGSVYSGETHGFDCGQFFFWWAVFTVVKLRNGAGPS